MRRVAVLLLLATVGCVGPARGYSAYEGKAIDSAKSALSAVETVRMAVGSALRGEGTAAYLSRTVGDAEEEATGAEGAFGTIQPPDARSDALREDVERLLSDAVDAIENIRIAMRRSDVRALHVLLGDADEAADALHMFVDEHA